MVITGQALAHHRTGVGLILADDLGDSDTASVGSEISMINQVAMEDNRWRIFNVVEDPVETNNLLATQPEWMQECVCCMRNLYREIVL